MRWFKKPVPPLPYNVGEYYKFYYELAHCYGKIIKVSEDCDTFLICWNDCGYDGIVHRRRYRWFGTLLGEAKLLKDYEVAELILTGPLAGLLIH